MHIQDLRNKTPFEEIDYLFLKDVLKEYSEPRSKIRLFLKNKDLIRVKKGLYIFGPNASRGPYCKEALANLIYGPSAISLEYALGFYDLIPERVYEVTNITIKRNKKFNTPIGRFTYRHLHPHKYPIGINQIEVQTNHRVLMATPEKALCDMLMLRAQTLKNQNALEAYLFEDLRVEEEGIMDFDQELLSEIALRYKNTNVDLLKDYFFGRSNAKSS